MGFGRSFRRFTRSIGRAFEGVTRGVRDVLSNPLVAGAIGAGVGALTGGAGTALIGFGLGSQASNYIGGKKQEVGGYDFSNLEKSEQAKRDLELDRASASFNTKKKYGKTFATGTTSRWGKVVK